MNTVRRTFAVIIAVALAGGIFYSRYSSPMHAEAAWYDSGWGYRTALTIPAGTVGSDLDDFPVYVDMADMPTDFWTHANADCSDVRITTSDGSTEVPVEVASCSSSNGELYFKAPVISSASDTIFYIYYGNASASMPAVTATYGRNSVWSNGFGGVWHMGTATLVDSTGNVGDSTTNTGTVSSSSLFGTATDYDGSSQQSIIPDAPSINADVLSSLTYTLWLNAGAFTRAMEKGDQYFLLNITGAGDMGPLVKVNTTNEMANVGSLSTGTWYQLGGEYSYTGGSSGTIAAIKNGALVASNTGFSSHIDAGSKSLYLGSDDSGARFNGRIDEVRISSVVRSSAWLAAEYANGHSPSTFYSFASEEADSSGDDEDSGGGDTGGGTVPTPSLVNIGGGGSVRVGGGGHVIIQ
jgi:hypothetical protein